MLYMLPLTLLAALPLVPVWAAPYKCSLKPQSGVSAAASSTGSSSPSGGGTGTTSSGGIPASDLVSMSWFAGWHATADPAFLPANISWSKYTAVSYAFAVTTEDPSTVSLGASDEVLLPQFVQAAKQNNVKAMLTVGGWTGSQYYSTVVSTPENRDTFANAVLGLVSKYDLDGLDFDWEYPNNVGIGCNNKSPDDAANFLSFLQTLRSQPAAKNLTLSAPVGLKPFVGSDGSPMTNVSAFADVLDYIEVMNYDVWGSWSTAVGPNAPLNDTCAPAADQQGSAVSAVAAWTAAGFPASQIVLGVPSYGHSFTVEPSAALVSGSESTLAAYPAFVASQQPLGDAWDTNATAGVDQCGNPTGGPSGIFDFWGLVEEGFLTDNGTAAHGIAYRFDNCSQTPYVYNPDTKVMVSFDNPQSFAAKGSFISDSGLGGFAMWETGGDYEDMLVDAIRKTAGFSS
ncbi:hypothetical protein POSPLDRAFT_126595 [Postia placenta Mad-698-R]|nr:hypothetical protein POSPLDRAFT_126595 [Postia placenta Mad-698-R]